MEFGELIEARRSVRNFASAEMTAAELEAIVVDALNAPSWKNTEVTRYYAACSEELKARLREETMPSFNAASSANASAFVAVTFRRGESGYMGEAPANAFGEGWGAYDCGIASAYFVLAARNRGWDSLIIGLRDEGKIREIFGIPADETLTAVIALGKAAGKPGKPVRKPVQDVLSFA